MSTRWFWAQFKSAKNIFNLPNTLTLMRIVLIPVMGIFLACDDSPIPPFDQDWFLRYSPGKVATVIVFIAGMTDLLDGWLARRWGIESLLGKFLDPIADKLLLLVALIVLMQLGRVHPLLVILLLSREFLITALRGVAAGEGLIIAADQFGKLKLVFQMLGLGFLMWHGSVYRFSGAEIGTFILYAALIISLGSGFKYLSDFFQKLQSRNTSS